MLIERQSQSQILYEYCCTKRISMLFLLSLKLSISLCDYFYYCYESHLLFHWKAIRCNSDLASSETILIKTGAVMTALTVANKLFR